MHDIEEGRLAWTDSMQWSVNRLQGCAAAVASAQAVSSQVHDLTSKPPARPARPFKRDNSNIRICKYFNSTGCSEQDHHEPYKHWCALCFKIQIYARHAAYECTEPEVIRRGITWGKFGR